MSRAKQNGLIIETIHLPQDEGLYLPAVVCRPAANSKESGLAVILSHHSWGFARKAEITRISQTLAKKGYVVIVPEHASTGDASPRRVTSQQKGVNFISLYGVGDTVGRSPLVMRVWDNISCVEYLSNRSDVAKDNISIVGMGIGGVDAAVYKLSGVENKLTAKSALLPWGIKEVHHWLEENYPASN